jgi:hypothetical protein
LLLFLDTSVSPFTLDIYFGFLRISLAIVWGTLGLVLICTYHFIAVADIAIHFVLLGTGKYKQKLKKINYIVKQVKYCHSHHTQNKWVLSNWFRFISQPAAIITYTRHRVIAHNHSG